MLPQKCKIQGEDYAQDKENWEEISKRLKSNGKMLKASADTKSGYIVFLNYEYAGKGNNVIPNLRDDRPTILPCITEARALALPGASNRYLRSVFQLLISFCFGTTVIWI